MSTALCIQTCLRHCALFYALCQPYLLVCVGRDNWADHRSCWDLHRFNRGDCRHRRHGSWDSCYGSPQNFLLKPGKAGHTTAQDLAPILKRWVYRDSAFTPANLSSLTLVPTIPKVPYPQDRTIYRIYRGLEAPGLDDSDSRMALIAPYRGPYRAISASISFKRSSPLFPGMPAPGPGTTGPPAPGRPGAGPAPAIAATVAIAGITASAQSPPPVPLYTLWLRQGGRPRMTYQRKRRAPIHDTLRQQGWPLE